MTRVDYRRGTKRGSSLRRAPWACMPLRCRPLMNKPPSRSRGWLFSSDRAEPGAPRTDPARRRPNHLGAGVGLVDEHGVGGIKVELRQERFFKVIARCWKNRHKVATSADLPCSASSRVRRSSSVMSDVSSTRPIRQSACGSSLGPLGWPCRRAVRSPLHARRIHLTVVETPTPNRATARANPEKAEAATVSQKKSYISPDLARDWR